MNKLPFKGKSHLKQYNPQKPKKCVYKIHVLSGIDEIIYDFKIYTGSIMPCLGQPDLQASGNIALQLVQHILRSQYYKLYFGNWYTSVLLEKTLHDQEIATVGTVRSNRLYNCMLSDDKYGYLVLIMWSYEQSSGLTTAVLPSFQRTNQLNQPKMQADLIKNLQSMLMDHVL